MPRTAARSACRALLPVPHRPAPVTIPAPRDAALAAIAAGLGFETLATRNRDQLDFHEVAVWRLKAALEAAYAAGAAAAGRS